MGNEKARKLCGQTWEKAVVGECQWDGMLGDLELCTVRIAYKVGGYSNIPDIVINFSNSFSFAITKYTQLSHIAIQCNRLW